MLAFLSTTPASILLAGTTVLFTSLVAKAESAGTDDLDMIRSRVMAHLLTTPEQAVVNRLIDSMQPDGSWTDIDYTSRSRSAIATAYL